MIASAEEVMQNIACEEYGVTSAPYSFGGSSAMPLTADMGSVPQMSYREFGESPQEKQ